MKRRWLPFLACSMLFWLLFSPVILASPPLQDGTIYVVQEGDSLWKVAQQELGNGNLYSAIVAATNEQHLSDDSYAWIANPAKIQVGWKLSIPPKDSASVPPVQTIRPTEDDIIVEELLFPEGPFWSEDDQQLYFVEWSNDKVWVWEDGETRVFFETEAEAGPCGIFLDANGNVWLTLYSTLKVLQLSPSGEVLHTFDNYQGEPFRGPNDLFGDDKGGLYFSDSGDFEDDWTTGRAAGALYYITPELELLQVDSQLHYPNGVSLSADGKTLFVNEHRKNRILTYAVAEDGTLSNKAVFLDLDTDYLGEEKEYSYELGPDGMALDSQGNIWIAHYGGGKVLAISPQGIVLKRVLLPTGNYPTNVTLTKDDKVLFVTESESGVLYRIELP